ncbi:MAG TPA: aldose epimerase family protein [Polyangiaceae bacterium]|nr:aldose epimerase family protein [Polyangiaceae bacterium]
MTSRSAHSLFGCFLLAVLGSGCSGSQPAPASAATPAVPVSNTASQAVEAATPGSAELNDRPKEQAISEAPYGTAGGIDVKIYTLKNKHGLVAKITNYGGIVTEFHAPDRTGKMADIVLGYDRLDDYLKGSPYFGAVIGRVANRIRNAQFTLDGKSYKLNANNDKHTLHGGKVGWDKVVWVGEVQESEAGPSLKLSYVSNDGEEGFPGRVIAHNTYTLTNDDQLKIEMDATTDKPTIVNMAHHSYWNLGGHDSGPITDEELTLFADQYTPGDPVPDGKIKPVSGTPFDFTLPKTIGKDLKEAGGKPLGFDSNWIVKGDPHTLRPVARLKDPKTGRVLELSADQPGVQFYSGNFLDGSNKGKGGALYRQYAGLCLESQRFPNSINVPAWKDQVILRPGVDYRHTMVIKFSVE